MLRSGGFITDIGDEHIFDSKTEALSTIVEDKLDHNICSRCPRRIFKECDKYGAPADNK